MGPPEESRVQLGPAQEESGKIEKELDTTKRSTKNIEKSNSTEGSITKTFLIQPPRDIRSGVPSEFGWDRLRRSGGPDNEFGWDRLRR